jgi:hypothetical protein
MNEHNARISKENLKKLILSNRTEIDKTIREATDYLDTLHHASHILFHIVHAFSLYIDEEEIKNDLEHILEGYDLITQSAGIPLYTYMDLEDDEE